MQARDVVDDQSNDGRHNEGVAGTSEDIGDLDVELLVIVIQPATINHVDSVEADDVVGGEEGVEEETDHACDAVLSEDIHAVIDTDPEFDYHYISFTLT